MVLSLTENYLQIDGLEALEGYPWSFKENLTVRYNRNLESQPDNPEGG